MLFICTGVEYIAWPTTKFVRFVRASVDLELMSDAGACNIKLVPLNPLKTKLVGKTGLAREKKAIIRVKKGVREARRTQFPLQESIFFFLLVVPWFHLL